MNYILIKNFKKTSLIWAKIEFYLKKGFGRFGKQGFETVNSTKNKRKNAEKYCQDLINPY